MIMFSIATAVTTGAPVQHSAKSKWVQEKLDEQKKAAALKKAKELEELMEKEKEAARLKGLFGLLNNPSNTLHV